MKDYIKKSSSKKKSLFLLIGFVLVSVLAIVLVAPPMLEFFKKPEQVRAWVEEKGMMGQIAYIGMIAIQVIIALIPGEPLEIAAGYVFGTWEGTILCLLGTAIGSSVVFLFVKTWGMKAIEPFFPKDKIEKIPILNNPKKLELLTFILFFIPGTPKDILTWAAGLTPIRFRHWMLITIVARFPSIITSTVGGDALGTRKYEFAIIVFAATLAISVIGILIYKKIETKTVKHTASITQK